MFWECYGNWRCYCRCRSELLVGVVVLRPPVLLRVWPIVPQPVGPIVGVGCPLLIVPGGWSLPGLVQVFLLRRPSHSIVIQDQPLIVLSEGVNYGVGLFMNCARCSTIVAVQVGQPMIVMIFTSFILILRESNIAVGNAP